MEAATAPDRALLLHFFSGYRRSHQLSLQLEDQFDQLDHQLPPQSGERRELEDEEEGGLYGRARPADFPPFAGWCG